MMHFADFGTCSRASYFNYLEAMFAILDEAFSDSGDGKNKRLINFHQKTIILRHTICCIILSKYHFFPLAHKTQLTSN